MFKYLGAALAGAVMLAATSASALVSMQDRIVGGDPDDLVTFDDFVQFNLAGTLQSVTLSWDIAASGTTSADACLFFQDCDPATFTLTLFGFDAMAGAADSDTDSSGITNDTDDLQFGSVSTAIAGSQGFANLGDFIGGGLVGSVDVDGFYSGFPNGIDGTRSGTVTLTYVYELTGDVPEPGVLALFATGLGLLGFAGWRRAAARR